MKGLEKKAVPAWRSTTCLSSAITAIVSSLTAIFCLPLRAEPLCLLPLPTTSWLRCILRQDRQEEEKEGAEEQAPLPHWAGMAAFSGRLLLAVAMEKKMEDGWAGTSSLKPHCIFALPILPQHLLFLAA